MRKGERFIVDSESIRHEADDPAYLCQDLAEINAKYGSDARVVFEQLALRLELRALAEVKAKQTAGKGGRPVKPGLDGETIRLARSTTPKATFADLCGISVDTLDRAERNGGSSEETTRKITEYLKTLGKVDRQRKF